MTLDWCVTSALAACFHPNPLHAHPAKVEPKMPVREFRGRPQDERSFMMHDPEHFMHVGTRGRMCESARMESLHSHSFLHRPATQHAGPQTQAHIQLNTSANYRSACLGSSIDTLQILDHGDERGVQMADLRKAHRGVHSGMCITRARTAEEPGRRIEAPNLCDRIGNSHGQGRLEGARESVWVRGRGGLRTGRH